MDVSILILRQMLYYFIMILMGFVLVKAKKLRSEESRFVSVVAVYLVTPCVIINAFQMEYSAETVHGLLLALGAAVAAHLLFLLLITILGKVCGLNAVEKASVMYTNSGNMIIPVVMAVLGPEWVLYSSVYVSFQLLLQWTHGRRLISGEKGFNLKIILSNIHIWSILLGLLLFLLRVRLPGLIIDTLSGVGGLLAPLSMFVMGMLMAGNDLRKSFANRRIYLIAALRLLLCPLLVLVMFWLSGAVRLLPNAATILFISFLACTTPPAVATTQMAQLFGNNAEYASAINIITTIFSLATIPLMTTLYWALMG